jgi:hypothetical protein
VIEDTNVNQNFVMVPGAIVYTYAAVGKVLPFVTPNMGVSSDALSFVTMEWAAGKSSLTIIGNHYPAVSLGDQSKIVGILSDDV